MPCTVSSAPILPGIPLNYTATRDSATERQKYSNRRYLKDGVGHFQGPCLGKTTFSSSKHLECGDEKHIEKNVI